MRGRIPGMAFFFYEKNFKRSTAMHIKHYAILIVSTTLFALVGIYLLNQFSVTKPFVAKAIQG